MYPWVRNNNNKKWKKTQCFGTRQRSWLHINMSVLNATEFCYVNFTSMFSLERERTQGATIVLIIKGMHLCAQIGMDNLRKELQNTGAEGRDLIFTEYPWYRLNFYHVRVITPLLKRTALKRAFNCSHEWINDLPSGNTNEKFPMRFWFARPCHVDLSISENAASVQVRDITASGLSFLSGSENSRNRDTVHFWTAWQVSILLEKEKNYILLKIVHQLLSHSPLSKLAHRHGLHYFKT